VIKFLDSQPPLPAQGGHRMAQSHLPAWKEMRHDTD
jgi:hypothetical protein